MPFDRCSSDDDIDRRVLETPREAFFSVFFFEFFFGFVRPALLLLFVVVVGEEREREASISVSYVNMCVL